MVNRNRGFTLLEVLVALLVFGLIATAAAEVGSKARPPRSMPRSDCFARQRRYQETPDDEFDIEA